MKSKTIAPTALLAATLLGCATVEAGQQGVTVSGLGAPEVNGCMKEESHEFMVFDEVYRYPARDISWDASDDPNAAPERGPYEVLSKDQTYMKVPITVSMSLTTNCDDLKQFHRDLGTKYQAWTDDGWTQLLNYVIGQPIEQTVLPISLGYDYQQLWNDPKVRDQYRDALQRELPEKAAKRTGGKEYFNNFIVTIGAPTPVDERLRNAKSGENAALAEARTAETKATADANARKKAAEAEADAANAEAAAKEAEARKRAAEIAGFGTGPDAVDAYLKWLAIDKGITPWPNPVVPGSGR